MSMRWRSAAGPIIGLFRYPRPSWPAHRWHPAHRAYRRSGRSRRAIAAAQAVALAAVVLAVPPAAEVAAAATPTGGLVGSIGWGWTDGEFSVTHDGAATYTLPLWVPKGRGGLQPELSLSYHSRSGNGPLGVGWSLGGLSTITPCPRTLAQDRMRARVTFSTSDAYCLDGNRLRPAGAATGSQREYRTERDPFARVIGYGPASEPPGYFRVWTRDGKVLTFGTPDSPAGRLLAYPLRASSGTENPSLARAPERVTVAWQLTRIEDRNANSATVQYQRIEDSTNLWSVDMRPTSITYGPNRSVRFTYEARPDPVDGFSAGVHTRVSGRISRISMYAGAGGAPSELLREYRLSYQTTSTTGRSLLRQVEECDHNGVCLKPLQFTWSLGGYEFDEIDTNVTDVGGVWSDEQSTVGGGRRLITGDIDGDGRDDLLYADPDFTWRIRRSSGSGFAVPTAAGIPKVAYAYYAGMRPIDVDNDGRLDVMAEIPYEAGRTDWYLYRSNGSSFVQHDPGDLEPGHTKYANDEPVYFVDLDGNGASDYAATTQDGKKVRYRLNTGASGTSRFLAPTYTAEDLNTSVSAYTLDTDGDGRAELLGHANYRLKAVGLDAEGGVVTHWPNLVPFVAYLGGRHFADVNGDGLDDVVYTDRWPTDALSVQLNSGNGFSHLISLTSGYREPSDTNGQFEPYDRGVRIVDFDNDGRQDVMVFHGGTPTGPDDFEHGLQVYVWRDGGFVRLRLNRPAGAWSGYGFPVAQPLDIDGDGVVDVVHKEGDHLRVLKRVRGMPDRLVAIGVGDVGPRVEVEYATLSAAGFAHTPGTCTYPRTCLTQGGSVVRIHREYHGAGWNQFVHSYQGARVDVTGRGWLGFDRHTVVDMRLGAITETEFDNVTRVVGSTTDLYPYAHLPRRTTYSVHVDTDTEFQRTISNGFALRRPATPDTYTVELRSSTDAERERPVGATTWRNVRVSSAQMSYDAFGNPTVVDSAMTSGRRLTERMTYRNDEAVWLVGLMVRRASTGCVPGGTTCGTRQSKLDYDDRGNLSEVVVEPGDAALLQRTRITRTSHGNVQAVRTSDAAGTARTERLRYDADDLHVTAVINALGHTTRMTNHSGLGVVLERTDPNGVVTAMRYDWFGRLRETNYADGDFEHIQHQFFFGAHALFTRTGSGGLTITLLDPLGREQSTVVESFGGTLVASETKYDPLGRVSAYSRPTRIGDPVYYTTLGYDRLGRLVTETAPDGATVRHDYRGLQTHTYDAKGVHSYQVETPEGDVAARYEDDPRSTAWLATRFEYGPFGELTRTVAPDGTSQSMEYDRLGRRIRHTDPSAGTTLSTFNAFDEQTATVLADGQRIEFEYDALGRVTRRRSADGVATYTWDSAPHGVGQLAAASSADGVPTRYAYDELGRVASTTWTIDGNAFEIGRGYDAVGRPSTISYPDVPGAGRLTVGYVYDDFGYLTQVKDASTGLVFWRAEAQNAAGQLERERFGNGVVTTRSYDVKTGLPVRMVTTGPGTVGTLDDVGYGYDPNRNLTQRSDKPSGRFEVYGYDTLNRLTSWRSVVTGAGQVRWKVTFAYDQVGNLTQEVIAGDPDRVITYRYGGGGAGPHALTSRNGAQYGYDANGRQTSGPDRTVRYNVSGLPTAVNLASQGQRTEYAYDADGARVLKRDRVETTVSVPGLYERRSADDVRHIHYVVAAGAIVAQVVRVQERANGPVTATGVAYLHTDPQGSVVQVTGVDGRRVEKLFYDPFGRRVTAAYRPLADERRTGPRQGYTGHYHDDELGLIDMKGRTYDPELRRFLTPDPVVREPLTSQGHNRYSYVWNNPATLVDPTGFWPEDDLGPWGPPEPTVDPEVDPEAWVEWTAEWTEFAGSLDAEEPAPSSDDDSGAEPAWQRPEVIVIEGTRPNQVERDDEEVNAADAGGAGELAAEPAEVGRAGPARVGSAATDPGHGPMMVMAASAAPTTGTLSAFWRWINKRIAGRTLATYLNAKGGATTYVEGATQQLTRTQVTERAVQKAKPAGKAGWRTRLTEPTKPTKVRGGFGFGWNVLLSLFDDLGVWLRADENGRSFQEQLREESNDAKFIIPLGVPLPLPNTFYGKGGKA
jgi:RHS repeat-associated protein